MMQQNQLSPGGGRRISHLALFLVLLLGLPIAAGAELAKVFQIETGYLSGMEVDKGPNDEPITAFLGIPYAAPPVGELRFRPPQPAIGWDALYEGIVPGPACMQPPYPAESFYTSPKEETSEDCLYLNVWTGAQSTDEKRPVMVWIHGGALTRGSGSNPVYDGTNLAKKGVVLVTINYRLGPFGYMAHPALSQEDERGSSGNYGVLDQIAALQWVERNIHHFGGDPDRVTIFGESAGSWSVNALVATPLAKGLIHGAIGQSGGLFGPMPQLDRDLPNLPSAEAMGVKLASTLGVDKADDVAAALRELPASAILEASAAPGAFRTRPNVDGFVFPESIHAIFEKGEHNAVPVLIGSNEDEATSLVGSSGPRTLDSYRAMVEARYGEQADQVLDLYPAADDQEARAAFLQSATDQMFTCQMRTWARLAAGSARSPAYLYRFTRVPPHPEKELYGSFHAAEIVYAFNNLEASPFEWEKTDFELAEAISDIWVSFATDGKPDTSYGEFPAYDPKADNHLELGDVVKVGTGLASEQCDFIEAARDAGRATSSTASSGSP